MKALFHTLGCKLNQVETEAIASAFIKQGIGLAPPAQQPDIIVINTCTVTSKSEQKARGVIRRFLARYEDALIIITGCYAQVEYRYLLYNFTKPYHALVIPQEQKHLLLDLPGFLAGRPAFAAMGRTQKYEELRRRFDDHSGPAAGPQDRFAFHTPAYHFHSRAFLKIQDGCGNACAYCRVPMARGRSRSLAPEQVLERVEQLVQAGFREIVLTGVNIGDYRADGYTLKRLVGELLDATSHVRFRLSSLEPDIIDPALCAVFAHERICPHFHLPLQSGSNRVLAAMRRRSGAADIRRAVSLLREVKPDAFLAADIITGFPGESDEDFEDTERLIGALGLHKLHVFPFSARPDTAAYTLKPRVPSDIIKQRSRRLLELSRTLYKKYLASCTGRRVSVVLEQRMKGGSWQGSCEHSLKCRLYGTSGARLGQGILVTAHVAGRDGDTALKADFLAVDRNLPVFTAPVC